jgi:hypothetical protein
VASVLAPASQPAYCFRPRAIGAPTRKETAVSSYLEALAEYYDVEVVGEAAYSALLTRTRGEAERLMVATLLQAETETKAWLRAPMLAAGLSLEERPERRQEGLAFAAQLEAGTWAQKMQALHDGIAHHIGPRYERYAQAARERGVAAETAVCAYMVEHEQAQVEFTRRQLAGADADQALEPVVKFLKYPLK